MPKHRNLLLCLLVLTIVVLGSPAYWSRGLSVSAQAGDHPREPTRAVSTTLGTTSDSFRYGVNFGHRNGAWSDTIYADLAAAAGQTSHRPKLPEYLFAQWGYDIELADMAHYQNVGLLDLAGFLIGPIRAHSQIPSDAPDWQLDYYAPLNLYEPIWLSPGVVNPDNYWASHVFETVIRYHPYVRVWEVWNEPDWTTNWWATQDEWWTQPPNPNDLNMWNDSVFAYIRMLRITHEIVQALAPEDSVAVGGLGYPSFLDAILRYTDNPADGSVTATYPQKGGAYFDAVSFHYYPHYAVTSLETGQTYLGWNSDEAADGFLAKRRNFEWVLESRGYDGVSQPRKEWLSTETGIASKSISDYAGGGELMRNYLIKMPVAAHAKGMLGVHWFMLTDREEESGSTTPYAHMGLYTDIADLTDPAQAQRKADAYAYETVSSLLDGAVYDAEVTDGLNLSPEAQGYAFWAGDGRLVLVLWAKTAGSSESASATVTLATDGPVELRQWDYAATGSVGTLEPVGGQVTVALDGSPTFVTLLGETQELAVYPDRLVFLAEVGREMTDRDVQVLEVRSLIATQFAWEAERDADWLQLDPASGSTPATVDVGVEGIAGLPVGTYAGQVTITAPDAGDSPQSVSVELHIVEQLHRVYLPLLSR